MNKFEFADRAVERTAETRDEKAERIIREAESRNRRQSLPTDTVDDYSSTHRPKGQTYSSERDEPPLPDNPAPLSSALGVPTLLKSRP